MSSDTQPDPHTTLRERQQAGVAGQRSFRAAPLPAPPLPQLCSLSMLLPSGISELDSVGPTPQGVLGADGLGLASAHQPSGFFVPWTFPRLGLFWFLSLWQA